MEKERQKDGLSRQTADGLATVMKASSSSIKKVSKVSSMITDYGIAKRELSPKNCFVNNKTRANLSKKEIV